MDGKRVALMVAIVVCSTGVAVAQTEWTDHADNPVLGPGPPGSWDEDVRFLGTVLFDGSVYHMWFAGGDGVPGDFNLRIGHATSDDGVEWTMDPSNPVLTPGEPGDWDEALWGPSPAVIHDGSQYHMWYSGAFGTPEEYVVRCGYATSPDGSTWTKHPGNPVIDLGPEGSWDDEHVRPGAVVFREGSYVMWYPGWDGSYTRIGYATSPDGIEWTKLPEPLLDVLSYPGAWDERAANPSVVFDGSMYHMWYMGWHPSVRDWMVGYAFSTDGIQWSRHRYNPVISADGEDIYVMPVVFDGTTWHGWYGHWDGETHLISYATSDCCPAPAALDHAQYIPAAALASGAEGSFYQTDLDLNNAGSLQVEYQLMWLPRGEDSSDPMTSESFTLGAGMSVRYANVLAEVFNLEPNSLGALGILSTSPDLLAMSRTYNIPSTDTAGTFGQAMPAVAPGDFIQYGDRKRILFATEHADMRTNVGCQNGSGEMARVNLELFDNDGNSLETTHMILDEWSNDQLNQIFDAYRPVIGYVDVWTPIGDRPFYCYGSVLDNETSDPTTILPQ